MELWDAYDKDNNKLEGVTLVRGEPVPAGLYHLVCDVLVRHSDGTYLLMRRAPNKTFGGMWEATAGGSALAGESALECAKRELSEETGIVSDDLIGVGTVTDESTIYKEFLCVTEWDKNAVVLQEGETDAYKWVTLGELLRMRKDELVTERMQRFIGELGEAERYIASPCEASSLSFRKSQTFAFPEGMFVLRDGEYSERELSEYSDEPYFKLVHHLEGLEKSLLPEGFSLVSLDLRGFSMHIRACYGGGPSEEELGRYAESAAFDPSLFIAAADAEGSIAATGVAELDGRIGEGVIEWIQVSPAHRRRGLGAFLVRELLWRMKGRAAFVTVSGRLNDPNDPLALYKKCGFGGEVVWHVMKKKTVSGKSTGRKKI